MRARIHAFSSKEGRKMSDHKKKNFKHLSGRNGDVLQYSNVIRNEFESLLLNGLGSFAVTCQMDTLYAFKYAIYSHSALHSPCRRFCHTAGSQNVTKQPQQLQAQGFWLVFLVMFSNSIPQVHSSSFSGQTLMGLNFVIGDSRI